VISRAGCAYTRTVVGRVALSLTVMFIAACDAPTITVVAADAGDAAPYAAEQQQAQREAEVFCTLLEQCVPITFREGHGERAECVRVLTDIRYHLTFSRGVTATIAERRACIDRLRTNDCVAFMRATSGEFFADPCELAGTLKDGEGCAWSGQCESKSCSPPCGLCVRPSVEGGKCPCSRGFVCTVNGCVRRRELGESCRPFECMADLVCNDGSCAAPPAPGAPCAAKADFPCGPWWRELSCDTSNHCVPLMMAKNRGDACGLGSNGVVTVCPFGSSCRSGDGGSTGECTPRPRDGEACGFPGVPCLLPAGCASGTCRRFDAVDCNLPVVP